jgi:hypothetical protein
LLFLNLDFSDEDISDVVLGVLEDTLFDGLQAGYGRLLPLALRLPQGLPVLTSTHFS